MKINHIHMASCPLLTANHMPHVTQSPVQLLDQPPTRLPSSISAEHPSHLV
uniref:Uncharacterized protein n=1 Tax=Anguilla anguilla TaxID=7936 RepID=A0A0E9WFH9_ANGAN